ncbi:MAG: SpoIIE family protein phosphatase [Clostridiales Family XIII bacterium]|nr:SpoIIE family protein phosphatase [Clostridiales Family XIII bacterium]
MDNMIDIFGNALECASIPAMIVDGENSIVHTNRSMSALFGDVVGRHRSYLFASDAKKDPGRPDPFETLFADIRGDEMHAEAVIADVTYEVICQHISCGPFPDFSVMIFEDVTEKKNLETEISESLKLLRRETSIAKDIQNSILPTNDEHWNTIRINAEYLPAGDLGGDVYDLVKLNNDETLIYIADVAGHGIQASLLTIYLRENIRANADAARESLGSLMKKLLASYKALDIDAAMYIGLLLCKYNKERQEIVVLNAGHTCYPLIIRRSGRVEELPIHGMPLSKFSMGDEYKAESVGIYQGDRLILFTDGLAEEHDIRKQEPFGSEGIRRTTAEYQHLPSPQLVKKIVEKSEEFTVGKAKDDRTILIADIL